MIRRLRSPSTRSPPTPPSPAPPGRRGVAGTPDSVTQSLLTGSVAGMTLDANTGAFSWTPPETQDGTYTVTFRATDNHGATNDQTITITVNEVNTDPSLANP